MKTKTIKTVFLSWILLNIFLNNEIFNVGKSLVNSKFMEFNQFLEEQFGGFLDGLRGVFLSSLSSLIEIDNDAQVSPDIIDAILPHLQEFQNQLTNPEENASQLLVDILNVQNLLSDLETEINKILFNSVSISSTLSEVTET